MLGKPVENRAWYTTQRGRIWLHASKFWKAPEVEAELRRVEHMAAMDGIAMPFPPIADLKRQCGCIVGSVEIYDCVRQHPSAFFAGPYGFLLRNPIALPKPMPFQGALRFFEVPVLWQLLPSPSLNKLRQWRC